MESNIFMIKDRIQRMESSNDEQTINLFYDETLGQYVAFGLSAYYTTLVTDPYAVYSEEMDMPMVRLEAQDIKAISQKMKLIKHEAKTYYKFQLQNRVGQRWYHTSVDAVKKKPE